MIYNYFQTFISLLFRDILVFRIHMKSRFIDACIWSGMTLFVSQYILPQFGVNKNFGTFIMIGNIAAWGMLEAGTNVSVFIADILGNNALSYYLTLPLPQTLIFIRIALIDACKSSITALPMLFIGKLILQDNFSLLSISYGKLGLSYLLAHLFFGFFGLFLSSITPSLEYLSTVKLRIIFPLWFLGCYQFTWHMLKNINPTLAYLDLLNPITYIMEGMRSSLNTNTELISYSTCCFATIFFTIFFGYIGITLLKKRLDCL